MDEMVNPLFPYVLELGDIKEGLRAVFFDVSEPITYTKFTFMGKPENINGAYYATVMHDDREEEEYILLESYGICMTEDGNWIKTGFAVPLAKKESTIRWVEENQVRLKAYNIEIDKPEDTLVFSE